MATALNRKVLLSALAASAVMIATPTLAQNYGYGQGNGYGYGNGQGQMQGQVRAIDQRQANLEQRVNQMASNGRISRSEYRRLNNAFNQFDQVQRAYSRNGYSRQEIADLNNRLERLQAAIRYERREDRRDDRWDRNDRDDDRNDRGDRRRDRDDD